MSGKTKPTRELPGGQTEDKKDDGVVNDSLGTVNPADSVGTDEDKETRSGATGTLGKTERNVAGVIT